MNQLYACALKAYKNIQLCIWTLCLHLHQPILLAFVVLQTQQEENENGVTLTNTRSYRTQMHGNTLTLALF